MTSCSRSYEPSSVRRVRTSQKVTSRWPWAGCALPTTCCRSTSSAYPVSDPVMGEVLPEDVPLVAVRRGTLVESVHRGRLAVCGPEGDLLEAVGDPVAYIYVRSAAKPL